MIEIFDAVFVCNGHYFAPNIPKIEGANQFRGNKIHSHDYRSPEPYCGMCFFQSIKPSKIE